jgi:hypothetical protein
MINLLIGVLFFPSFTFCGENLFPDDQSKNLTRMIDKVNAKLDNFGKGIFLPDDFIIKPYFIAIRRENSLEFFKMILSSPHQFTVSFALFCLLYESRSENFLVFIKKWKMVSTNTNFLSIILNLIFRIPHLVEDLVFASNDLDLESRIAILRYITLSYHRLYKTYLSGFEEDGQMIHQRMKVSSPKTLLTLFNHRIAKGALDNFPNLLQEFYSIHSPGRCLLLRVDPTASLFGLLSEVVGKAQGSYHYKLAPRENFILKNLIRKFLELDSFRYLQLLADQNHTFNCFFWFIAESVPTTAFLTNNSFPTENQMASEIRNSKFFKEKCFISEIINNELSFVKDFVDVSFVRKIWKLIMSYDM